MLGRLGKGRCLIILALALGFAWLMYQAGLVETWSRSEEYSHGGLVLLLIGYVVYKRRADLAAIAPRATWLGPVGGLLALAVMIVGAVAGIFQLQMYSVWLFAVAVVLALGGLPLLRKLFLPLMIAFMVIPLPKSLEPALTAQLQLISSQLGVWVIRLFGGVVYQEGNVIDMGGTRLLVAEACAGLRYLYPLMSLGAIGGYLLRAPLWMRWLLFLSTIPITIFMNSFRIGVTGLLVETWGSQHTEGFLHFFEGWVVFIAAALALLLVAWVLVRLAPERRDLFDAFSVDAPPSAPGSERASSIVAGPALVGVTLAVLVAAVAGPSLAAREEVLPQRQPLTRFPAAIDEWTAREYRLPPLVEAVAGASEYFYADFFSPRGTVNLYVSYYHTQRQGQIPHSPAVCIPGDGWVIVSNEPVEIRTRSGEVFEANRLITAKGDRKVLAYYWLKQGQRMYRRELLARLDLIRFSALERRTDGALIRLVAELMPGEAVADADQRLGLFAQALTGVLSDFVPD